MTLRHALVAVSLGLTMSHSTRADETSSCVSAYETGQRLRLAGKLQDARNQLTHCAALECPALARVDCVRWLRELEETIPTVIFRARDPAGADVIDVQVSDGTRSVTSRLTGTAVPFDPGEHQLRFDARGFAPLEKRVVIVQAERNRIVDVVLEPEMRAAPPLPPSPESRPPSPALPLVLAGVGVASLAGMAFFGLRGWSDVTSLHDDPCAATKSCAQSDVDRTRRELLVADILGGVAVVCVGLAAWIWIAGRSSAPVRL